MAERETLFNNLKTAADVIVKMFGLHCEVAVHDLRNPHASLIHIAGHVTRRKKGAPITDLVLKALRRDGDAVQDMVNYHTRTRDGRVLKSSTAFIRNKAGKVIGAFCINFDTTEFLNATALIDALVKTETLPEADHRETFAVSVEATLEALIDEAINHIGKQPSTMSKTERMALIQLLDQMGAFYMKGAVVSVANVCGVSKFTVYNYLNEARRKNP